MFELPGSQTIRELYAHILTPVFLVDAASQIVLLANSSAAKTCGFGVSDLEGQAFFKLFHSLELTRLHAMMAAGDELGIYSEFGVKIERKSGRVVIVDIAGRKFHQDGRELVVFTLQDVTELKQANVELEDRIRARTQDLEVSKNRLQAILNNSQQGFFTFGRDLKIEAGPSLRARKLLGSNIVGKPVAEAIGLPPEMISNFGILIFDRQDYSLIEQVSTMESEIDGRYLRIVFAPIFEDNQVKRVLATVSDETHLRLLKEKAEKSAKESRSIIKILQSRTIFLNIIHTLKQLDIDASNQAAVKRFVHTLKGEFSFFECEDLVEICQMWEEKWARVYVPSDFNSFLHQFLLVLDTFLDRYESILKLKGKAVREVCFELPGLKEIVKKIQLVPTAPELLADLETLLSTPIDEELKWLGESWLLVARTLGKKVEPLIWENSIELFSNPYQNLFASLIHAIRNSADHGVEPEEVRKKVGKSEKGHLFARIEQKDDFYHLYLRDDGCGLDPLRILKKAQKKGLPMPGAESDIFDLLFEPEFSTRDQIGAVSGAGVGLNVIRDESRKLGGDASIGNAAGAQPGGGAGSGTELHIWFKKIPITEGL